MAKMWSKKYISLYYILDFDVYVDALKQIAYYSMNTNEICDNLHKRGAFSSFKNYIENYIVEKNLNMDAINFEDWISYVCDNRHVIERIKVWTDEFYSFEI